MSLLEMLAITELHYGQGSMYTHTWKMEFLLGQAMAGSFVTLQLCWKDVDMFSVVSLFCKVRKSDWWRWKQQESWYRGWYPKVGAKESCLSGP